MSRAARYLTAGLCAMGAHLLLNGLGVPDPVAFFTAVLCGALANEWMEWAYE